MTKNRNVAMMSIVAVILVCVAAAVPRLSVTTPDSEPTGSTDVAAREIRLVVKDMTFYVEGQDTPNPTLSARPGERIRLVLNNTESGMSHDFRIDAWRVKTRVLKGKGQDSVEFTVPNARGSHEYRCTPHAEMMNGTIVVN
jgi:plastocyanin